jgi:hypothetical protein|tara:strand:+ start:51 stop:251 length:201 start_codon:yes stop_codon:yes gene_type:complete
MTDISKYKNLSLPIETYGLIDVKRRTVVPGMILSRSQYVTYVIKKECGIQIEMKDKPTKKKKARKK